MFYKKIAFNTHYIYAFNLLFAGIFSLAYYSNGNGTFYVGLIAAFF